MLPNNKKLPLYLKVENEDKFDKILNNSQNLIKLALMKCNIRYRDYDEFYPNALEGLLISFIMLEKKYLLESEFKAFAFVTMKRKIIDELRRRKRWATVPLEDYENLYIFRDKSNEIEKIDFYLSIERILDNNELEFFELYLKEKDVIKVAEKLNIGKTKAYTLLNRIKNKCYQLLYKYDKVE